MAVVLSLQGNRKTPSFGGKRPPPRRLGRRQLGNGDPTGSVPVDGRTVRPVGDALNSYAADRVSDAGGRIDTTTTAPSCPPREYTDMGVISFQRSEPLVLLLACAASLGCPAGGQEPGFQTGSGPGPGPGGDDDSDTGTAGDAESSTTSGGETSSSTAGGDGDGIRLDVGPGSDTGGDPGEGGQGAGCTKIDFLFVVDNSTSMRDHQENLKRNFGGFIDSIVNGLGIEDYQIMIIDSDGSAAELPSYSNPPDYPCDYYCEWQDNYAQTYVRRTCDGEDCAGPCEHVLGGGKTGNRACGIGRDAPSYLTSDLDGAELIDTFECIIETVAAEGDANEMVMTGMAEAITTLAAPGECNEGFLRDDAILVVTFVSDDHQGWAGVDDANNGDPQAWYDAVVQAKGGKPESAVMVGLIGERDLAPIDCLGAGNADNPYYLEFFAMFGDRGHVASVCEDDYLPVFEAAIPTISDACDDFIPPG